MRRGRRRSEAGVKEGEQQFLLVPMRRKRRMRRRYDKDQASVLVSSHCIGMPFRRGLL